jgi:hypothetical protein
MDSYGFVGISEVFGHTPPPGLGGGIFNPACSR